MSAAIVSVCRNCGADRCEMRQKPASNGTRMIAYQCLDCGSAASHWLKQASIQNAASLPPWDPGISEEHWKRKRAEQEAQLAITRGQLQHASEEWWERYNLYLRTPAWRSRRSMVLQRAGGWCEGCRKTEATQVHHLTYEHVCNEFLWELVAICDDCHERAHQAP